MVSVVAGDALVHVLWPEEMQKGAGVWCSTDPRMVWGGREPGAGAGVFVRVGAGCSLRVPEGFGYRIGGAKDSETVALAAELNHPGSLLRN